MVIKDANKFFSSFCCDDYTNHLSEQCCINVSDVFSHSVTKVFQIVVFSLRPSVECPYVRWCIRLADNRKDKRNFVVVSSDLDFARREFLHVLMDLYV